MESNKIFLSQHSIGNYNANRLLYIFLGLTFIATGLLNLDGLDIEFSFRDIFSIVQIVYGVGALVYSIVLLSPRLKFAPRFEFFDNKILIKKEVFSSPQYVVLESIKSVKFGFYEVGFTSKQEETVIYPIYTKNSDNSIAIKEEIAKRANQFGIEVIAG